MANALPENATTAAFDWPLPPPAEAYYALIRQRPPLKTLLLAVVLFLLTLCTCLAAGTQFAAAYANNQAVSIDEFVRSLSLFYRHPAALWAAPPGSDFSRLR